MYEQSFIIAVAFALWFFEVLHYPLPDWVKGIEAVWFTVSTVPLTFLRNTNIPLLKNLLEKTLLFFETL